jgi:hypothetical protein
MRTRRRYRCRLCGTVLPAWIPVMQRVDSARLLHHLSQDHPSAVEVTAALDRMQSQEDIARVLLDELFEAVEGES